MFHRTAEETLEAFLRRIRLERAAYMLLNTNQRVGQVAHESGYQSPEAFSRAFRRGFGCLPTDAKGCLKTWEIEAKSDLHWNAGLVLDQAPPELNERVERVSLRYACVLPVAGDYAKVSDSWQNLQTKFSDSIPRCATFITIYRDNLWTHPVCRTMRYEVGWLCDKDAAVPEGMRKRRVPSGSYATTRFVERTERTAAWSHMWGRYLKTDGNTPFVSYDEYASWPLPFEKVKTRLFVLVNEG